MRMFFNVGESTSMYANRPASLHTSVLACLFGQGFRFFACAAWVHEDRRNAVVSPTGRKVVNLDLLATPFGQALRAPSS